MFLGRAKTDNLPDGSPGPDRVFLEDSSSIVAADIIAGKEIEYFHIALTRGATTLNPVTLKGGARRAVAAHEVAEIIADGKIVGETEVIK